MRIFREGLLSSLVTRLTLAVLAVLLLSLGLTAGLFALQSDSDAYKAAVDTLRQNTLSVRTHVVRSLLNTNGDHPLARVGALSVDGVILTSWPDNAVVDDTLGTPISSAAAAQMSHGSNRIDIGGTTYAYLVVPARFGDLPPSITTAYRSMIMLEKVKTLRERVWDVVRQLALPGAFAIVVSLLTALLVLRAVTRPLHSMTLASERMAAGDYDQQVAGADSADEVGQLARSFNRMASEVKRVREMQRQFIANVSHDLRSPLTSIIGFSQALTEDEASTPSQRRAGEIIHDEAERLSRLTLDLLDLSRLEAGRLPLSKELFDLNDMLRQIAARYQALPSARGVRFAESLGTEPLPVLGDPDRLTQVVVNLIDNACKFCNVGGTVRLSSTCREGQAIVKVYNSGAGIAADDLPRVFDRFYRADHSRAQQKGGSGIGLAIVRELVQVHGGSVMASSELGASTTMTVRLPLMPDGTFTKDLHKANSGATDVYV